MAILVFLLFVVVFALTYAGEESLFHQKRFLVRIPPPIYLDFSAQDRFWQSQKPLFPQEEMTERIPEGVPNYRELLIISFEKNKSIKINSERSGKLSDIEPLKKKLREIFRYREEKGIIDENSRKPIKAVMLKAPRTAKYGEVTRIVDALKESGVDPIILQIDCLPQ